MNENCATLVATNPCAVYIRIRQAVYGPAAPVYVTYTVASLAQMWHRTPSSVRVWLSILRKSRFPPVLPFVRLVRLNAVRKRTEIRSDYAALIRAVFIDRTIGL